MMVAHRRLIFALIATATFGGASSALATQLSTVCHFNSGPKAGKAQDFAPMKPLPVGSPCQDGIASSGVVVPGAAIAGAVKPKSTICGFIKGPLKGTKKDYAPMAPLNVGSPCHDGVASWGYVVAK